MARIVMKAQGTTANERKHHMKKPEVFLVPFSHMDLGWTYYVGRNLRKIGEKVSQIVEGFVDRIEADPERRFTGLGTFGNVAQIVAENPALLARIRALVAEGRIDLPGHLANMPNLGGAEFHTTPESLVRNLIEGRRLHQRIFGRSDARVLHFPDVTGSFGNLPQLLLLAGYEAYRLDRGCGHQPFPHGAFLWRGIDGSEVIAAAGGYCGNIPDIRDETAIAALHERWAQAAADSPAPLLRHLGHDLTEADTEEIAFCRQWNQRYPDIPLTIGTYASFFAAVAEYREQLPRFEGTIDPIGWTATYGMNGYKERRAWGGLFDAIQEVEAIAAVQPRAYPERQLRRAWMTGLCFQEHGASNFLLPEDHAQVYGDLSAARREVDNLRAAVLHGRATELATGPLGEFDIPVAVFNSLPWARREPVEFTARFAPSDSVTDVEVVDATDRRVDVQPLAASFYPQGGLRETRLLWQADVPAGGEAVYRVRPLATSRINVPMVCEVPEWHILENDALTARFSRGTIKSLTDGSGHNFCPGGMTEQHGESILSALGAVSVRATQPPDQPYNWGMMNQFGKSVTLMAFPFQMESVEDGPIRRTVRITRDVNGDSLIISYTLVAGRPALDIGIELATQRSGYRWEMAIPFAGLKPHWRRDEHFGASEFDPANHKYGEVGEAMTPGGFFCQSYVDARFGDSSRGLTVISPNQPGFVAAGEVLNATLLTTAPQRLEDRTCRFVMSPETLSLGQFEFNYRLWAYEDRAAHEPARRAMEMRFPLRCVEAPANTTGRPGRSNLSITPGNIVLSAHYIADGRMRLRVYESEGIATEAEIRMEGATGLQPVDLLDRSVGDPIPAVGDGFRVHFSPYQIRTFLG